MNIRLALLAFCFLFLPLTALADTYKVGDSFVGFSAPDQHGAAMTFKAGDARTILFDTPDGGEAQTPNDPQWFSKNQALLLVNISNFSGFKRRVAASRMEAKPFKMLVVGDQAAAAKFPVQSGKFTVLKLDAAGKITAISYASPGAEVKKAVEGG
jgi:hypothetical protein